MNSFSHFPSKLLVRGNKDTKQVALTYNACTDEGSTLPILKVLEKNNVKATFFLTGIFVDKFPEISKKIYSNGHEIGNHSYNHENLSTLTHDEIMKTILDTEKVMEETIGVTPKPFFREPYGAWNNYIFQAVGDCGYEYSVYWTIDTKDCKIPPTRVIVNRVLREIKNGSIILMHLDSKNTVEATDIIIKNLKAYGYKFVTISQIL